MPSTRRSASGLAALLVAAFILVGCGSKDADPEAEPSVPAGYEGRAEWAVAVAEVNRVSPRDIHTIEVLANSICKQIREGDDLTGIALDVAKIDKFSMLDAVPLVGIAIYGYCPQHKAKWRAWDYSDKVDLKSY